HKAWFETFEHEPVRTSEEAAKTRIGYTLKQGAKAIIVRVKERGGGKYFAMLVMPGDTKISTEKDEELLSAKDIRFATEDEVKEMTGGVLPGGVPPFGNLFGLKIISDPSLFENEKIVFNAGDRSYSIAMYSKDYKSIVNPEIETIIE
ncbi:MAG: hypothetical protein NT162_04025, partial [Candidatus Woesebacteria bacterium]|nr:hypothetical protein [Candidatus Woesebacteria bacterium]